MPDDKISLVARGHIWDKIAELEQKLQSPFYLELTELITRIDKLEQKIIEIANINTDLRLKQNERIEKLEQWRSAHLEKLHQHNHEWMTEHNKEIKELKEQLLDFGELFTKEMAHTEEIILGEVNLDRDVLREFLDYFKDEFVVGGGGGLEEYHRERDYIMNLIKKLGGKPPSIIPNNDRVGSYYIEEQPSEPFELDAFDIYEIREYIETKGYLLIPQTQIGVEKADLEDKIFAKWFNLLKRLESYDSVDENDWKNYSNIRKKYLEEK